MTKTYTIKCLSRNPGTYTYVMSEARGTMDELNKMFGYTLECGASYSHEKGKSKINRKPKTLVSLIKNLNNAVNNSSACGYAGKIYS